jgi:hypothetical protein
VLIKALLLVLVSQKLFRPERVTSIYPLLMEPSRHCVMDGNWKWMLISGRRSIGQEPLRIS